MSCASPAARNGRQTEALLLADPEGQKISIRPVRYRRAVQPLRRQRRRRFYCTKIASKLVRTYTDRHGLKGPARELLGIEIPSSSNRPTGRRQPERSSTRLRGFGRAAPASGARTPWTTCFGARSGRDGGGLFRLPADQGPARLDGLGRDRHIQPRIRILLPGFALSSPKASSLPQRGNGRPPVENAG